MPGQTPCHRKAGEKRQNLVKKRAISTDAKVSGPEPEGEIPRFAKPSP
jgi:hypothetical protein